MARMWDAKASLTGIVSAATSEQAVKELNDNLHIPYANTATFSRCIDPVLIVC